MNLATKVALNTVVQIFSKIISIVLGLATIAIMTRYLGQVGFGEYTTVITYLSFFAVAADLGLTLVTVQMISQPNADQNKILSNLFSLRLFSAAILLIIAPMAIWFLPYANNIKIGVAIASASFLFPALNQILVGLYQKVLRLDKVSIAEITSRIILLVGIIATAWFNWGLYGILWASVTASVSSFILHYCFSLKLAKISLNFNWRIWQDIIHRSWPIGLTIVFNLIYLRADTLILSLYRSSEEVGIYGATYRVIDTLITLPFIFAGIVLPIMTAGWLNDKKQYSRVLQKSFDLMSILAVPLFFGTQFLADRLMILVAGKDFAASGPILRILILAACIIFLGTMFSHAVIAIDQQRKIIGSYFFVAITALAGYLIFIPKYSYFGAAWVTIYSELAIAVASAWLVWRASKFTPKLNILLKSFIASLLMCLWLWLTKDLNLWLNIVYATSIYFVSLFLIKGVTKRDLITLFARE